MSCSPSAKLIGDCRLTVKVRFGCTGNGIDCTLHSVDAFASDDMARIEIGLQRVGPTRVLIKSARFYPKGCSSPEDRLRYYAGVFPMVEVDSSYYALPSIANSEKWAERTPGNVPLQHQGVSPIHRASNPRDFRLHWMRSLRKAKSRTRAGSLSFGSRLFWLVLGAALGAGLTFFVGHFPSQQAPIVVIKEVRARVTSTPTQTPQTSGTPVPSTPLSAGPPLSTHPVPATPSSTRRLYSMSVENAVNDFDI